MADIHARTEIGVTTGPIRGSRKIHVATKSGSGIRVAMREIDLAGGEPSVRVYDTSGPYTDPHAHIDISAGLPELRRFPAAAPPQGGLPALRSRAVPGRARDLVLARSGLIPELRSPALAVDRTVSEIVVLDPPEWRSRGAPGPGLGANEDHPEGSRKEAQQDTEEGDPRPLRRRRRGRRRRRHGRRFGRR